MKDAERTKATEEIEQWKEEHRQTNQEMSQLIDGVHQAKPVDVEESGGGLVARYDADDETDGKVQDTMKAKKNQKKLPKQQPQRKFKGERPRRL